MFFCGAMAIMLFFVGVIYAKNKERIYLYYTLFLLFSLGYGLVSIQSDTWIGQLLGGNYQGNRRFVEPVTLLAFAAYIAFAIELIDVRAYHRRIAKTLSIGAIVCVLYAVGYFVFYEAIRPYTLSIFIWVRIVVFAFSTYFLVWILRHAQSPIKTYFVLGSFAYFVGSVVASVRFSFSELPAPWLYQLPAPSYFEMGILAETICFTLALGQRMVVIRAEKDRTQQLKMERISAHRRAVREQNERLKREVKAREKVIRRERKRLHNEADMRLKAELERELARAETRARALEINPHFLYNCLNSIMYLIQSEQNKKASEYLTIFSRFIRLVLETSRKSAISLHEELNIIEKYLKLERNRFGQDFSYRITGTDMAMLQGVMVPPMLLYPIVENAVWHGVMNSPAKRKEIVLAIEVEADKLVVRVTDNGLGWISTQRKPAAEGLCPQQGISLTKERIKLFNQSYENKIDFSFHELSGVNLSGTEALFMIILPQDEAKT